MSDTTIARPAGPVHPAGHSVSLSGLTEDEAKGFHSMFVVSFLGFLAIAIVAHFLVWQWRPWIPGTPGYPEVAPAAVVAP